MTESRTCPKVWEGVTVSVLGLVPITSETLSPRVSSRCLTICASPFAPKKMKTAIRASRKLPPSSPIRKKAKANSCPTLEAISVALSAPRRVAEQAPQHAPAVQRKGGDQVEECEHNIEVAKIEEELPHRPDPCEQVGWHARYGSQQKAQTEEHRGEYDVHQGTGEGYLDLVCRLLGEGLQIGDSAYGQKRYAVNLDAQALSHQGVAELVQ